MKKVININFQGRVIPIEETAFETLKQYVESLRRYFANEEGREEIINDIQDRIAELFTETLKKGATCITDEDVSTVMTSMGRPEDFGDADDQPSSASASTGAGSQQQQSSANAGQQSGKSKGGYEPRGRLYRNDADKIIGGVCSGLANYLRIDPVVVRILFAVITFGGFGTGLLVYIVMWIALPSMGLQDSIRKRLYRSTEDRMISGVCGGAAAYFDINVWIPRLIFAAPFLVGILIILFRVVFIAFDPYPVALFNGFGGTMAVIYIILWAVVPQAVTATEKLEMRGEKIDLESIKNTVQDELNSVRDRVSEKAQQWGQNIKQGTQNFTREAAPVVRKTGTGFGHAIGVLFKAFFLFIGGIIAFTLLMTLLGLFMGGIGILTVKTFFLEGFWENFLAWAVIFFFIGVPILAMVTWLIRRIIGAKTRNKYIGYAFGSLWLLGFIAAIVLTCSVVGRYKVAARVKDEVNINTPSRNKLIVKVVDSNVKTYGGWFHWDGVLNIDEDTILLNRVRVKLLRSEDSTFHVFTTRFSRGNTERRATENAENIRYEITQEDSVLYLGRGFDLGPDGHFRNQELVVTVQIPVGKRIEIDHTVSRRLNWFNIESGPDGDWEYDWNNDMDWDTDVEYLMTPHGLERTDGWKPHKRHRNDDNDDDNGDNDDDNKPAKPAAPADTLKKAQPDNNEYRYKSKRTDSDTPATTSSATQGSVSLEDMDDNVSSSIYRLIKLF